jgi:hypothetical protein
MPETIDGTIKNLLSSRKLLKFYNYDHTDAYGMASFKTVNNKTYASLGYLWYRRHYKFII